MPSSPRARSSLSAVRRIVAASIAALGIVAGVITAPPATASVDAAPTSVASVSGPDARTADLSKFQPGNIISDAVFFDSSTMTAAQIQAFLEEKVPSCRSGYTCLKDWYDTSRTTSADAMCGAYSGGYRERASQIIYKVAQACGINPQVILATLQKEQGLVNHVWPSDWRYTIAMGQGCPDTAACDERYYGFFNQVYGAAWQFKRYANPPGTSQYFTWYAPGKTWNILYNPDRSCGSSPVAVQNQATANLYYYTPYQPNSAALRAGFGEGDGCSAYGNRNFYNYFTDWFGSTQRKAEPCRAPSADDITSAGGEFLTTPAGLNARTAPSVDCADGLTVLPQGTLVTRTGTYGEWWRVDVDGRSVWIHSDYVTAAASVAYETDRLAGANRYATAAAIAAAAHPDGADVVFLASGERFPDALSGSALALREGGAMLLTGSRSLPSATAEALRRLAPTRVVLLGGEAAISAGVERGVADVLGASATVKRLFGAHRYDTSRAIVAEGWDAAPTVYLATGRAFPDALSASAAAAATSAPVLLADGLGDRVPDRTIALLSALGTTEVVIAGGVSAISPGIEVQLVDAGLTVTRVAGASRWETSRQLALSVHPTATDRVFLASGRNFPDALTGSVLAGYESAPLLIQPPTCMTSEAKDYFIAGGTSTVTLLGGPAALSESVADSVRCR